MNILLTVVVTSISAPNKALISIAKGCNTYNQKFIVIGDKKSPPQFHLENCDFVSLEEQLTSGFKTAELCPLNSYSRKNIGYLLAIRNGSEIIIDTDDDNFPENGFWSERNLVQNTRSLFEEGWVNVYRYFTEPAKTIWPRGLPLDMIHVDAGDYQKLPEKEVACPIQQGLADENPDVDAIYRLAMPLPVKFKRGRRIALGKNTWSPFNSQNTAWWKPAFPLLYLPSFCSFRMTDIWRSFVGQRIAWENEWYVLYHEPTVYQERNEHNLLKDFEDEIPGYLKNISICNELSKLHLKPGVENLAENLLSCYERLVQIEAIGRDELSLLEAWINDLEQLHPLVQ